MSVYKKAAEAIRNASVIVITAGAGMGVDSGLPDFRGEKGFWKAYPLYEKLGLNFVEMANPIHFERDPAFGWGFYGHRLELYRKTQPHEGFQILLEWIERYSLDYFVVTSNVDGQFQKAGFPDEKVYEIHGSIHYLQCIKPCCNEIWENTEDIPVDYETMRAKYIPRCRFCGDIARPNVLMFGDFSWVGKRTYEQSKRFDAFLSKNSDKQMVVVEIGAGTAIPSIRHTSERLGRLYKAIVIRINPREPDISSPHISIAERGVVALKEIEKYL